MIRGCAICGDFAGILALDKWTCNANGRQAAFWKRSRERKLTASFIDQGYCLQRRRMEFSRRATARRLRAQRRLRMCHIVGQLRAVAQPHRKLPRKLALAAGGRDSARMVWWRQRRTGATVVAPAGAPFPRPRADPGFQEFVAEPVSELARGGELSKARSNWHLATSRQRCEVITNCQLPIAICQVLAEN